jgi:hypothetical protein
MFEYNIFFHLPVLDKYCKPVFGKFFETIQLLSSSV